MADKGDYVVLVNGTCESDDKLLEVFTGIVDAPKSLDENALGCLQTVDRRGWADEHEKAYQAAKDYVDNL